MKKPKLKHLHRKSIRTFAETVRLREDRARYQRIQATPEELLAEGGHKSFITLGELLRCNIRNDEK